MERREPEFSPDEPIEFRPRAYRGPTRPTSHNDEYFYIKLSVGIGVAVLVALLIFNAFDRYQDRKDAEFALTQLKGELAQQRIEDERLLRQIPALRTVPAQPPLYRRPLAPQERCINGDRFMRVSNGWQQLPRDPC